MSEVKLREKERRREREKERKRETGKEGKREGEKAGRKQRRPIGTNLGDGNPIRCPRVLRRDSLSLPLSLPLSFSLSLSLSLSKSGPSATTSRDTRMVALLKITHAHARNLPTYRKNGRAARVDGLTTATRALQLCNI